MKKLFSKSIQGLEDLTRLAEQVNDCIPKKSIILLTGDLGAGKTTFVSAFCGLHNISQVSSPTYAIHNRYESKDSSVDHLDLYRLDDEEKIEGAGIQDILHMNSDYKFIEWPERWPEVENVQAGMVYKLTLKKTLDSGREAEFFQIS